MVLNFYRDIEYKKQEIKNAIQPRHCPHPSKRLLILLISLLLSDIACVLGSISREFDGLNNGCNVFEYVFNVFKWGIGLECDSDYDALSPNTSDPIDVGTATLPPGFNFIDSHPGLYVSSFVSTATTIATTVAIENEYKYDSSPLIPPTAQAGVDATATSFVTPAAIDKIYPTGVGLRELNVIECLFDGILCQNGFDCFVNNKYECYFDKIFFGIVVYLYKSQQSGYRLFGIKDFNVV